MANSISDKDVEKLKTATLGGKGETKDLKR